MGTAATSTASERTNRAIDRPVVNFLGHSRTDGDAEGFLHPRSFGQMHSSSQTSKLWMRIGSTIICKSPVGQHGLMHVRWNSIPAETQHPPTTIHFDIIVQEFGASGTCFKRRRLSTIVIYQGGNTKEHGTLAENTTVPGPSLATESKVEKYYQTQAPEKKRRPACIITRIPITLNKQQRESKHDNRKPASNACSMPQHDVPETLTADHQQHQATETMEYNPNKTRKTFDNVHEHDLIETLSSSFFLVQE